MAARPLYKTSSTPELKNGNAGLWYDKFCDMWTGEFDGLGGSEKREWIRSVPKVAGDVELLREMQERLGCLISEMNGKAVVFKTAAPFVTGLGRSNPVENGFVWHHTLGVPYLPGSSVKGMVRAWARLWKKVNNDEIGRIFGPESAGSVGSVVFLDALPVRPVELKAEIMTPHYGPYYQGGEPPADWHRPVPIPFLAVAEGQEFLFGVIPRKGASQDCEKVIGWLVEALEVTGAGAKTSSGYGRFIKTEAPERRTPGRDWLEKLAAEKGTSVEALAKGSPNVLADKWDGIEDKDLKKMVQQEIKRIYQSMGFWDDPPSKGMRKTLDRYKAWEVER